jgi:hypothetical protein
MDMVKRGNSATPEYESKGAAQGQQLLQARDPPISARGFNPRGYHVLLCNRMLCPLISTTQNRNESMVQRSSLCPATTLYSVSEKNFSWENSIC